METVSASKTRLCWNCEGDVPAHEENCTFCGVYIGEVEEEVSFQQARVPTPPYQMAGVDDQEIPKSPYATATAEVNSEIAIESTRMLTDETRAVALPLAFLMGGAFFFLFSVALLLFSVHGTLTLQWDGTYWYGYFGVALAFLALGWRGLHRLQE